jgi:hypothetical protein
MGAKPKRQQKTISIRIGVMADAWHKVEKSENALDL